MDGNEGVNAWSSQTVAETHRDGPGQQREDENLDALDPVRVIPHVGGDHRSPDLQLGVLTDLSAINADLEIGATKALGF